MMEAPVERDQVESQLLAYIKRLERNYYEWRAVHLHLSQLKPHNRRHYQLRIAASEFDGLLRRFSGELFQLHNGDIVYLWQGGSFEDVDQVVLRLRYLFSDDPLTGTVDTEVEGEYEAEPAGDGDDAGAAPTKFCSWFDLERDYDPFRFQIEDYVAAAQSAENASGQSDEALDPARLAKIEVNLATMDLSGVLRRQAVCAVLPQTQPQPLFTEIHVAIGELASTLVPGVDLAADTWLFQRLAESLDRRLLTSLIRGDGGAPETPTSINLRLATLLSPEFLKFDHEYRRAAPGPVIIELQLIDIFAELGAYLFIREFVRDRGYLICVDGLHYLHLPLIDRKRLGADLVKMMWSHDLIDSLSEMQHNELKAAIKRAGFDRVILCRCDSSEAVEWGQSMGIRLFSGPLCRLPPTRRAPGRDRRGASSHARCQRVSRRTKAVASAAPWRPPRTVRSGCIRSAPERADGKVHRGRSQTDFILK